MKRGERFRRSVRLLSGNGRDADGLGQSCNCGRIDRQRRGSLAELLGPQADCVESEYGNECEQQDCCNQTNPLRGPQKSTLS